MTARLSREAWVWLALLGATVLNWVLMGSGMTSSAGDGSGRLFGAATLIVAFVKAWLVIDNFMEAREAPSVLRGVLAGWTILACAALVVQLLI